MPAHFILALMLALIPAVGFGIVLRMISDERRKLREDEAELANLIRRAS